MVAHDFWGVEEGFESHVFHHKFNTKGDEKIEEIYEWIPGYEGKYKVSNMGDVVSYRSSIPRSIYQTTNNCGYKQVKLCTRGVEKHLYVHRLVAMVFVPGYGDNLEVNHKDLDKSNNTYTNLEWVTKSENHKHRCVSKPYIFVPQIGWVPSNSAKETPHCICCGKEISRGAIRCRKCEMEHRRKSWPSEEQLRDDLMTLSFSEIGRKYDVTDNCIRKICRAYGLPANVPGVKQLRDGPLAQSVRAVVS